MNADARALEIQLVRSAGSDVVFFVPYHHLKLAGAGNYVRSPGDVVGKISIVARAGINSDRTVKSIRIAACIF